MHAPPAIAIFNSSDDLVELLRMMFEQHGFVVVSGHVAALKRGEIDLKSFVEQHKPRAVVYDVIPPYERHWMFLDHLRATSALKDIPFVLTSTNAKATREAAKRDERVLEILGRPFDMDELLQAVRRAVEEQIDS